MGCRRSRSASGRILLLHRGIESSWLDGFYNLRSPQVQKVKVSQGRPPGILWINEIIPIEFGSPDR